MTISEPRANDHSVLFISFLTPRWGVKARWNIQNHYFSSISNEIPYICIKVLWNHSKNSKIGYLGLRKRLRRSLISQICWTFSTFWYFCFIGSPSCQCAKLFPFTGFGFPHSRLLFSFFLLLFQSPWGVETEKHWIFFWEFWWCSWCGRG